MSDLDSGQALSPLDRAAQLQTQRLNQLEGRLRAYESRLNLLLQTTKGLVSEVSSTVVQLDYTEQLLNEAVQIKLPEVNRNLEEIKTTISQLEKELPEKHNMIDGMQALYYSGRKRLRALEDELTWLTTPYIIQILKTSSLFYNIPRSRRWIRNVRLGTYLLIVLLAFWVQHLLSAP